MKSNISDLWKKEDWLAVWIGFIVILIGCVAVLTGWFDFSAAKFSTWHLWENVAEKKSLFAQMNGAFWLKLLKTFLVLGILFACGVKLQGGEIKKFVPAFLCLFVLAVIVRLISAEFTLNRYLEWAFWALIVGLLISNTVGVPDWLKPAIRTEFYIKTGLVIMGFSVLFSNIAKFGLYGLGIAWIVTPIVIIFMWWLGTKVFKMENKPLVITLAAATSVCGTSAAIATGAAAKAKKDDLSVAISISIIFTILMMVFEPMIIKATGMSQLMGGALIGGTVDSTGAVVLAGNALGPEAEQAAVLVKSIQNILIGFIAFFVAVFFATRVDRNSDQKVGAGEIWYRFPKFIIGFFVASLVASFIILPLAGSSQVAAINGVLDQYKNWAFVLAFTSIGLDTNFKEIAKQMQGGKVLWLYIIGQLFNIALTFFAVWFLLSGVVFDIPVLDLYK
ncbi:MAG: putative sulfate exporter family transporter [Bacteroidales bacterium]|nr:putative sulfate exporter family transporter [Bacteroidales bacterium]MBQ9172993.1 putative sulfate exporter family transporter [Bacteroidales bacterium]MBQ9712811.1 putative sulfate exporter family transporter [Bacteroidales bacterium]